MSISLLRRVHDFTTARGAAPLAERQYVASTVVSPNRTLKSKSALEGFAFVITGFSVLSGGTDVKLTLKTGKSKVGTQTRGFPDGDMTTYSVIDLPAPIVVFSGDELTVELFAAAGLTGTSSASFHGLVVPESVAKEWLYLEGELRIWEMLHDSDNGILEASVVFNERSEITHLWVQDEAAVSDFTSHTLRLDVRNAKQCAGFQGSRALPHPGFFPSTPDTALASSVLAVGQRDKLVSTVEGGASSFVRLQLLGRGYPLA